MAITRRDTYSVNCSSIITAGNTRLIAINNNSASTVRINRISYKPYTSAAITGVQVMLEVYFLAASTTGGTSLASGVTSYDVSSPAIDPLITFYRGDTTAVSGPPICGGSLHNEEAANQTQFFDLYHYRGGEKQKQITLRPGKSLCLQKAPGAVTVNVGVMGACIEFTIGAS